LLRLQACPYRNSFLRDARGPAPKQEERKIEWPGRAPNFSYRKPPANGAPSQAHDCRELDRLESDCRKYPIAVVALSIPKSLLRGPGLVVFDFVEGVLILAEQFRQGPLRPQQKIQVRGPGLGVCLGVLDGDVVGQMEMVGPADALD